MGVSQLCWKFPNDAAGLLGRAKDAAAEQPADAPGSADAPEPAGVSESAAAEPDLASKVVAGAGFGTRLRQWLMTGVSYMIPFVAAGGLLIVLSFALGGYQITDAPPVTDNFDAANRCPWAHSTVRRSSSPAATRRPWTSSSPCSNRTWTRPWPDSVPRGANWTSRAAGRCPGIRLGGYGHRLD